MKWKTYAAATSMCAALSLTSLSAFAGGPDHPTPLPTSNFVVGASYATYGGSDYSLLVGYYGPCILADIGWGFEHTNVNATGTSFNINEIRAHLGLRKHIWHHLFVTGGALGSYGIRSVTTATRIDPYAVGAFVGLDYQPLRHFLLSFKLAPYVYSRDFNRNTSSRVFSEGSITFAYII